MDQAFRALFSSSTTGVPETTHYGWLRVTRYVRISGVLRALQHYSTHVSIAYDASITATRRRRVLATQTLSFRGC